MTSPPDPSTDHDPNPGAALPPSPLGTRVGSDASTAPTAAALAFELRAGALRLALRPDLGGCIAGLWHHGVPVLRSTEPALLSDSRQSASYPLVPYSNRLGFRRFRWRGRDYTTRQNVDDDSPHSLHGLGWQRPWRIVSSNPVEVVLQLLHDADADWPFAFEATQYFALTPDSLSVQMLLVNRSENVQPVGLGWHPYFPRRERSRVHVEVSDRWDSDTMQLPIRKVAQPGIDSAVEHLDFDNCFDGWCGPARIRDEKFSLQLTSSLARLVVYTPPRRAYFCVEPVSHVSNAIHMADPASHGLLALEPGERCSASMKLDISVV